MNFHDWNTYADQRDTGWTHQTTIEYWRQHKQRYVPILNCAFLFTRKMREKTLRNWRSFNALRGFLQKNRHWKTIARERKRYFNAFHVKVYTPVMSENYRVFLKRQYYVEKKQKARNRKQHRHVSFYDARTKA